MNLANQEFEATAEQYRFLANSNFKKDDVLKYVKQLLDIKDDEKISTRTLNICKDIFARIDGGLGQNIQGVSGTWWAVYNGFTEYLSYEKRQQC